MKTSLLGEVVVAIKLNRQITVGAKEIKHIWPHAELPIELVPTRTMST